LRAEPNGFLVHLLNHSDKVSCSLIPESLALWEYVFCSEKTKRWPTQKVQRCWREENPQSPYRSRARGVDRLVAELTWARGVVVSHPLSMREALGSIRSVSTFVAGALATLGRCRVGVRQLSRRDERRGDGEENMRLGSLGQLLRWPGASIAQWQSVSLVN
jgi:hypothetical protein